MHTGALLRHTGIGDCNTYMVCFSPMSHVPCETLMPRMPICMASMLEDDTRTTLLFRLTAEVVEELWFGDVSLIAEHPSISVVQELTPFTTEIAFRDIIIIHTFLPVHFQSFSCHGHVHVFIPVSLKPNIPRYVFKSVLHFDIYVKICDT